MVCLHQVEQNVSYSSSPEKPPEHRQESRHFFRTFFVYDSKKAPYFEEGETMIRSLLIILLTSGILLSGTLVEKTTKGGVRQVMDRIERAAKAKGMVIFARIDHRAQAKKAGMDMNDEELLLFGNPRAGTRIMLNDPRAGLELPMKILVYRDYNGLIHILYRKPSSLKEGYRLEHCALLPQLDETMEALAEAGAEGKK